MHWDEKPMHWDDEPTLGRRTCPKFVMAVKYGTLFVDCVIDITSFAVAFVFELLSNCFLFAIKVKFEKINLNYW